MWLRMPYTLLMAGMISPNISFIDSDTNPKITNLVIDECIVPILKAKLKDMCYIDHMAKEFCNVSLELSECCHE